MLREHDTIAAIATPPGRGGVGIIRLSGTQVREIAVAMLGQLPAPRHALHAQFRDADQRAIDDGIALYFPAPHSFTGEDVLELQGHGGPVVLDMVLARLVSLGARLAEPGEFSKRAFLNDKIDLVAAEAIADLIAADSTQAAQAALRSLQGEFSRRIHELVEAVIQTRMHVEAAIDFPDEELDLLADKALLARMDKAQQLITHIQQQAKQGSLLRDGMTVVIAGRPNAGKSSLLNCLAGYDAAIVTEVPGTTRDVLRERINIDGLPLHILDTAGLRDTADRVEAEGIRRARDEITRAHRVLYVVDATTLNETQLATELQTLPADIPVTVVINKVDLLPSGLNMVQHTEPAHITVSANTGAGIDQLRDHLKTCMGFNSADAGEFMARRRHLDALARAHAHLQQARIQLLEHRAGELCAEELRHMQDALNEITGEFTADDLLGRIFSSFCIGK